LFIWPVLALIHETYDPLRGLRIELYKFSSHFITNSWNIRPVEGIKTPLRYLRLLISFMLASHSWNIRPVEGIKTCILPSSRCWNQDIHETYDPLRGLRRPSSNFLINFWAFIHETYDPLRGLRHVAANSTYRSDMLYSWNIRPVEGIKTHLRQQMRREFSLQFMKHTTRWGD